MQEVAGVRSVKVGREGKRKKDRDRPGSARGVGCLKLFTVIVQSEKPMTGGVVDGGKKAKGKSFTISWFGCTRTASPPCQKGRGGGIVSQVHLDVPLNHYRGFAAFNDMTTGRPKEGEGGEGKRGAR